MKNISFITKILYIIGFLDLFAVSLVIPLLSKHARDVGASPSVAGLVGSIYGAMQLVFSPVIGRWSDVAGRRYVLMYCLLLAGLGYLTLGLSTTILVMALSRLPTGIFKHTQEMLRGYLADMTPTTQHSTVFGNLNAVSSIGFIIGPSLGGHIAEMPHGFFWVAMLTVTIFLLNLGIVWYCVPTEYTRQVRSRSPQSPSFIQGLTQVSWRHLWDIFLVRFLLGFAVIVYRNNFVMMLDYKYSAGTRTSGYITSYSGLIGTLSGLLVGRISAAYQNDSKLLLHAGFVQFASILMLTFSPSIVMLVLALTPLSVANQVARVCSINLTLAKGAGEGQGVLLGLGGSIMALARMISPVVGGVAQEYHISGPGIVGSVFAGLGLLAMLILPGTNTSLSKQKHKHKLS